MTPFAESLGLCGEALLAVIKFTEDIIKRRVKATYGSFILLTDPIMTDSDLNAMVEFTFTKLPHQCFIIMAMTGGSIAGTATTGGAMAGALAGGALMPARKRLV